MGAGGLGGSDDSLGYRRMSEADTCRKFVVPRLQAAGWEVEPHSIAEQRTITDGRIVPVGRGFLMRRTAVNCERSIPGRG